MTESIQFFYEETGFVLKPVERISAWVIHAIRSENKVLAHLNYIFCSDQYLHKINKQYLKHDNYTDIITFDHSEKPTSIEGDIYISIDRVKENSDKSKVVFMHELRRVIIHGVLHLIGFNDKSLSEKTLMRGKENAYLSLPEFEF